MTEQNVEVARWVRDQENAGKVLLRDYQVQNQNNLAVRAENRRLYNEVRAGEATLRTYK